MLPPNLYGLLHEYKTSSLIESRIVGSIFNDLNDRKGIKQALQAIDGEILEEIFTNLAKKVRCFLSAAPRQSYKEWKEEIREIAKDQGFNHNPCEDVEEAENLEAYIEGQDAYSYLYEGWINPN